MSFSDIIVSSYLSIQLLHLTLNFGKVSRHHVDVAMIQQLEYLIFLISAFLEPNRSVCMSNTCTKATCQVNFNNSIKKGQYAAPAHTIQKALF